MKENSKTGKIKPSVKINKTDAQLNKKSDKESSSRKDLIKNITNLLKDINEEGLLFLFRQAQVLIYNKKVDEHNAVIKKGTKISIKKPPFSDKLSMEIKEADDNSSFIFVINSSRKFFTLEEMRKLVKLCHDAGEEKEGARRLLTWYKNNRVDVLVDVGIEASNDPALRTMYNYIIKHYKPKG
jgi:hypothetical protein